MLILKGNAFYEIDDECLKQKDDKSRNDDEELPPGEDLEDSKKE